jgi:myo-inositol-1(or 4)-monophosphatase
VTDDALLAVLHAAADAVHGALAAEEDWLPVTDRPGQYAIDLVADEAAVRVLTDAGLGALSEESGLHQRERDVVVVVDPVDGSTNASRGLPWYATSLAAVDATGLRAAVVANQASGERFEARRGGGARRTSGPVRPSGCTALDEAVVGVCGLPDGDLGARQYRTLGAAALDLCAVASGWLDGFLDPSAGSLGPWDYLGGLLVCQEAGAVVVDAAGRDLLVLDHGARRAPVAAATAELSRQLLVAGGRAGESP